MWRNAKQKLWLLAELGVVCLIGFMLIGLVIGTGSATDYQEKELTFNPFLGFC